MASFDSHNFCARCREKGKGTDPCINKNDCNSCNLLTEEQRLQLSTPSYRLKKEKRDLKKSDTPKQDSSSSSLIDPYSVTVVGAVDAQGTLQSPGSSSGKAQKTDSSSKPKDLKPKAEKPSKSTSKSHKSSVDSKIDDLDQKWADRFNRLEALLLAKTLDKPDPAFTSVKVVPTHSPPASSALSDKPFIRPSGSASGTDASGTDLASQSQVTDQSVRPDTLQHTSDLTGSLQTVSKSTSKSQKSRSSTDRLADQAGTASPTPQQYLAGRHRFRPEDSALPLWILTPTPTFLIAPLWTFLSKRENYQIRNLKPLLPTPTKPSPKSKHTGRP